MKKDLLKTRSDADPEMRFRTIGVRMRAEGPSTFDREKRSVEVTLSSEEPVMVWGEKEVLLSDGARIPKDKKIVMLDTHNRFTVDGVLGSIRKLHRSNGEIVGTAIFSKRMKAEDAMLLVEEEHLTDFSVGYKVNKYVRIGEKETQKIKGREFTGPMVVVTDWTPREGSVAPIGADEKAKVRADEPETNRKGESNMDKRLREYLESRGLAKDATDDEAWELLARLEAEDKKKVDPPPADPPADPPTRTDPPPADPPAEGDTEAARAEGAVIERTRIAEITGMGERLGDPELAKKCINEGVPLDQARERFITAQMDKDEPKVRATVEVEQQDKFRAAAIDSIMLRSGAEIDKPADGADELRSFSLRELARESLRIGGHSIRGTMPEMVGRALVTGDFPYILADSARKSLFAGYDTAPETWQTWCAIGNVSDFKTHSSVRASETDDLDEIPDHGDYKYGDMTEAREQYSIATYGKLFAITRQTIINDDLNALSDVPRKHGEAAARKIGDLPYAVLTANANMGDGTALFHADHANLGTGGVVSTTTIAEGIKLMKKQKDLQGLRRLNIRPIFFLAPVAIEGSTMIFFSSELIGTQALPGQVNPYADPYFTKVYEPRLDDTSAAVWYLAGPKGKTVTVFFLNGVQTPYLETKSGWTVDGVEYKVRIDAGAKAMDWKALLKNAGA